MSCPQRTLCFLRDIICFLCLFVSIAQALSWGIANGPNRAAPTKPQPVHHDSSRPIGSKHRSSSIYELALSELQELESEPLCHRIAARLLVNNCQLLDGHDEASVLTDSGRATRDFVDFFAASLAICDLERASFLIPPPCSKFRESVLAKIPVPSKPHLHVSPSEIDSCLQGLARSDSAWNTWVSYRHKALRFCDAARVENEKDKNIHLFQRITKVLDRLTSQAESDLEARFEALNQVFRDTSANLEGIKPRLSDLKSGLVEVEQFLSHFIHRKMQQTATSVTDGLENARGLQLALEKLLLTVHESNEKVERSYELMVHSASTQISGGVGEAVANVEAAIAASASLRKELAESKLQAATIAQKQKGIEADMQRLAELSDSLTLKHESHSERLDEAHRSALQVLDTLESVSNTTNAFKTSLFAGLGLTTWWPYFFCPAVSLIVGSYGLPPSAVRNIALVGLGEALGFLVSVVEQHKASWIEMMMTFAQTAATNDTATQLNTSFSLEL